MSKKMGVIARVQRRFRQFKILVTVIVIIVIANFVLQVMAKPTEILSFSGITSKKSPVSTWNAYADDFLRNATTIVTPEFLAAIAQTESAGDPVAQPTWIFKFGRDIFNWYSPASSAVGLMQITDGNFKEAKKLCIHGGRVVQAGFWYDWNSCWFNFFYTRVFPSHSIELAAAYMHAQAENILSRVGVSASDQNKAQRLAAIIHLCGKERGLDYAKDGFTFRRFSKCGSHDASQYVKKVFQLKAKFQQIRKKSEIL